MCAKKSKHMLTKGINGRNFQVQYWETSYYVTSSRNILELKLSTEETSFCEFNELGLYIELGEMHRDLESFYLRCQSESWIHGW